MKVKIIYNILMITICVVTLCCDGNAETLYKVAWSNAIVLPYENVDSPDVSPDGRKLIFIKYRELTPETQYGELFSINTDGSGSKILLPKKNSNPFYDTNFTDAKWSPEGIRILLLKNYGYEMWQINADGTGIKPLTEKKFEKMFPLWSPDGSKIIYDCWGSEPSGLYVLDMVDKSLLAVGGPELAGPKTFSPDGNTLLLVDNQNLIFLKPDGVLKEKRILKTPLSGSIRPVWTPNGKYIILGNLLYVLETGEELPFLPDEVVRFKVAGKPDLIGPYDMSISKDGKKITFLMTENNSASGYRARIKIMDLVWK